MNGGKGEEENRVEEMKRIAGKMEGEKGGWSKIKF